MLASAQKAQHGNSLWSKEMVRRGIASKSARQLGARQRVSSRVARRVEGA